MGFDPRRHKLTTRERRKGAITTLRRYYFGGEYAAYLGQYDSLNVQNVEDLARLAGDDDRPGDSAARALTY